MLVAFLIVTPPADFVANVWPPHLNAVAWRYAAEGLFTGSLLTVAMGLFVGSWLAIRQEHRRMLLAFGVCDWVLALACVPLAVDFLLNALQMRGDVGAQPGALATYDMGTLKGVAKYLISSGFFTWLAVIGHRWRREYRMTSPSQNDSPLIARSVGKPD